ncbi:hypothetical protein RFI_39475 [Reticulomyxa filosa]|uniref:Amino acid permease/ SLC12A domain-containing protein n=1 Tax=Reticulomyxa filosa TaxID=46433 RepID=X6L9L6_RETFI|nr:hypothetical protein RFI_39475 [Reticulomyxa filosa]|eukprot:ETN98050.1 hypothetical protein RFI_39475 [Reticulomyxa filosa]
MGVSWVVKLQYWLIVILALAISSFLVGCFLHHDNKQLLGIKGWTTGNIANNLWPHYTVDNGVKYDFWQCLSLFFRYVSCCYFRCVNDFKPNKQTKTQRGGGGGRNFIYLFFFWKRMEIEWTNVWCGIGTISAIMTTSFVYLVMGIAAAGAVTSEGLLKNYLCMVDIAALPLFVFMGIYAATLSSALSVQLCAPRILMSVANDNVLPSLKVFGKTNKKGDPVASAFTCCGISLICVIIGDLNIVAPLITQVCQSCL